MNEKVLLVEEKDGIAVLTLNRPKVMNSFNFALLHSLKDQVDALKFNTNVRVVIITGAGQKAFCAGADLKERTTFDELQVKEFIFTIRNLFTSIEYLNKPVIAAINGVALVLASTGDIGPIVGAIIHNIGSIVVVGNSSRLIGYRFKN